ncbi:hypothetical protein [Actinomyces viscosus]|uniref:Uncharacterized protein n=1 Tax=Actinomyces viscosus TaxID=1656 RepID=A0A448PNR3_ACTVI|nr:hypothetical protein [Actinomyces viscosus]VEI18079.1 Uncharacterised protein [Actinomyces viscosus]
MTLSVPTNSAESVTSADAALRGCDPGVSFAMRRRSLLMAGFGLGTAGLIAACSTSEAASAAGSSAATAGSTAGSASAGSSRASASPEYHEASASNTSLSAGTWSGTIGDKQMTLSGAYLVDGTTATIDGGTFESTTSDQAVFLVVNGGRLTVTNAKIAKTGDATSSGQHGVDDSYNFYGLNSAVVVVGEGSSATVTETTMTTDASGANAVVATGGASATVTACAIATTGESSRGLHATYAGVINGSDLTIETQGAHCAAVATDRGSGTVTVEGANTFTTNGDGSPCLYSTGQITVSGLTGQANASQAVVVEGKNHATVSDSTLTSASTKGGVMLYQSMSGDAADADAATEVSTLAMTRVSLTCTQAVPILYVTNTSSQATLTACTLTTTGGLATAGEDRWGTSGSNGGTLALTMDATTSDGAITAGSTSSSITVTTVNGGAANGPPSGSVTVS